MLLNEQEAEVDAPKTPEHLANLYGPLLKDNIISSRFLANTPASFRGSNSAPQFIARLLAHLLETEGDAVEASREAVRQAFGVSNVDPTTYYPLEMLETDASVSLSPDTFQFVHYQTNKHGIVVVSRMGEEEVNQHSRGGAEGLLERQVSRRVGFEEKIAIDAVVIIE